jgi:hypothetical protein
LRFWLDPDCTFTEGGTKSACDLSSFLALQRRLCSLFESASSFNYLFQSTFATIQGKKNPPREVAMHFYWQSEGGKFKSQQKKIWKT